MRRNPYARRDVVLRRMGFQDYRHYLASGLWVGIRRAVMARDGGLCVCCGGRGWQVHHFRYDEATLLGERLDGMVAICGDCHRECELDESGRHRRLAAVNRMVMRKWEKNFPFR